MDFDDPKKTAIAGIEAMEAFYRRLHMPTSLRELGLENVSDEDIHIMADKCTDGGKNKIGNFVPLSREDIETILKKAR